MVSPLPPTLIAPLEIYAHKFDHLRRSLLQASTAQKSKENCSHHTPLLVKALVEEFSASSAFKNPVSHEIYSLIASTPASAV